MPRKDSITFNGRPMAQAEDVIGALLHKMEERVAARRSEIAEGMVALAQQALDVAISLCPVDTGNLVGSAYIVWSTGMRGLGHQHYGAPDFAPPRKKYSKDPKHQAHMTEDHRSVVAQARETVGRRSSSDGSTFSVIIGFSAYYAFWVHEGHTIFGKAYAPPTKFLERAVNSVGMQMKNL